MLDMTADGPCSPNGTICACHDTFLLPFFLLIKPRGNYGSGTRPWSYLSLARSRLF